MAKTFTRNPDGSVTIAENGATWDVRPDQVVAHRREPTVEAVLLPAQKVQLDQDLAQIGKK